MPVVAVVVAVAVDAVAVGAAVAGTITALGVAAAVGATLSAVGAVAKVPALTYAGAAIGAVGAIGSLAASAGVLGDSASAPLFGAAPTASTADAASAGTIDAMAGSTDTAASVDGSGLIAEPPAPPGGVGAVDPTTGDVITAPASGAAAAPAADTGAQSSTLASAQTNAANPADAATPGTPLAPQDSAALQAQQQLSQQGGTSATGLVVGQAQPPVLAPTGGVDPYATTVQPGVNAPPSAMQTGEGLPTPPVTPNNLGATDPSTGETISQAVDPTTGKIVELPDSGGLFGSNGALGGIMAFANKYPVVALGALQAGGSLLSGLTSTLTPAQVSAYNAQAAANNAAAALTTQQTANLAQPKAVASSAPVTGTPQTLVPTTPTQTAATASTAPAAIINKAPAVTGAPAQAA